jgi:hypothetical protein
MLFGKSRGELFEFLGTKKLVTDRLITVVMAERVLKETGYCRR